MGVTQPLTVLPGLNQIAAGVIAIAQLCMTVGGMNKPPQWIVLKIAVVFAAQRIVVMFLPQLPQRVADEAGQTLLTFAVGDEVAGAVVFVTLDAAVEAGFPDEPFVGVVFEGVAFAILID